MLTDIKKKISDLEMKSQAPYPRIRYEKQKRKMESEVGAGHQTTRSYRRGGDQVLQGTTHLQHYGAAVPQAAEAARSAWRHLPSFSQRLD